LVKQHRQTIGGSCAVDSSVSDEARWCVDHIENRVAFAKSRRIERRGIVGTKPERSGVDNEIDATKNGFGRLGDLRLWNACGDVAEFLRRTIVKKNSGAIFRRTLRRRAAPRAAASSENEHANIRKRNPKFLAHSLRKPVAVGIETEQATVSDDQRIHPAGGTGEGFGFVSNFQCDTFKRNGHIRTVKTRSRQSTSRRNKIFGRLGKQPNILPIDARCLQSGVLENRLKRMRNGIVENAQHRRRNELVERSDIYSGKNFRHGQFSLRRFLCLSMFICGS